MILIISVFSWNTLFVFKKKKRCRAKLSLAWILHLKCPSIILNDNQNYLLTFFCLFFKLGHELILKVFFLNLHIKSEWIKEV